MDEIPRNITGWLVPEEFAKLEDIKIIYKLDAA
jgi:hypothetical protein